MKTTNVLSFIFGAAVGTTVTWYFLKNRYEKLAQEEIDSVKAAFSKMSQYSGPQDSDEANAKKNNSRATSDPLSEKPDIMEYAKRLNNEGYTDYTSTSKDEDEDEEDQPDAPVPNRVTSDSVERPYVITPEEFRELDDYTVISLTYYADGVLADENDERVEDVDDVVGIESLEHFGEYDDDSVYVRNDRLKVDYEILRSMRYYSEILEYKPYLREGK